MTKITGAQALDARKALELTQGEVSKGTGIPRAYISQFENGTRKLTRSEVVNLKDFLEDKGFIFDSETDSSLAAVSGVQEETDSLQSELDSLNIKGKEASVSPIELGDLIDSIDGLVSLVKVGFETKSSDDSVRTLKDTDINAYERINGRFVETENVIWNFFKHDNEGVIGAPGVLGNYEKRSLKLMALMAMQYLRRSALEDSETPIAMIDGINSFGEGNHASELAEYMSYYLNQETRIDDYLEASAS